MPTWLVLTSTIWLVAAVLSAAAIAVHILRGHKQHMWIMNIVWPLTALWAGPIGLYYYFTVGTLSAHERMEKAKQEGRTPEAKQKPFRQVAGIAASHCGSGCTLGDIIAESLLIVFPLTLFGHKIFAAWVVDYILAFGIGIAFQYFTIKPMRDLSVVDGLKQAVKADVLSITAWQVGMYGWMAIATFAIFGHEMEKSSPVFWFMMQIAMFAGFATSFPMNWWLVKTGVKEKM